MDARQLVAPGRGRRHVMREIMRINALAVLTLTLPRIQEPYA